MSHPNENLIALGIQQPWAELILQRIKTIEVRNVPVAMRTTIYLYSSQKPSRLAEAKEASESLGLDVNALPRGEIVGTVEISDCRRCEPEDAALACVSWKLMEGRYSWVLKNPHRVSPPLKSPFVPYGMWFYPFKPRNSHSRERT